MGLCAWQKEKREAEDHVHGQELQSLESIGSSVPRDLSRDNRGQKNHQHKSGREGQVHRRWAKDKACEYQDRRDEKRHLHTRTDSNRERQVHPVFHRRSYSSGVFRGISQDCNHENAHEDIA
jgi:hypothetical protein